MSEMGLGRSLIPADPPMAYCEQSTETGLPGYPSWIRIEPCALRLIPHFAAFWRKSGVAPRRLNFGVEWGMVEEGGRNMNPLSAS
jgi:hypothetical protein